MIRRRAFPLLLAAPALLGRASAQAGWPDRPVKLVIPFPPGNTADIVARLLTEGLAARLGHPIVVENRVGAAGTLGVEAVARARDGHSFLLTTASPLVISPAVQRVSYDPVHDFVPVSRLGSIAVMLVGRNDLPAATLMELVALLRANPGRFEYASVGPGTFTHLTMELFRTAIGAEVTHVPYRGAGAAHADLIGGRVALMFDSIASANAQVAAGRLRGFAVSTPERSPFAPAVPTVRESGIATLQGFDVAVWAGLLAPAGTPPAVVAHLGQAVSAELARPEFQERLRMQSIAPQAPEAPEAFARILRREVAQWTRLARELQLDVG
ncbi:Bug family tripartite tricarboxylate transporter substrate binding protein [Falsiroseomonas selenitidurans]|uniref:Tripartite tricarboxylate transporter substrate binding protein n=1 Tax=Falsiroseomonas selenitidurans TaxID=2716335 RepID=A0ABX1EAA1_9PROT|nr:tripartite tricarboxylate transporter substrate-binding protein [Falsiroseomonas selenitidurans]NKC33888.1 tripartite tricarboxylate transporter substrate binding protein [Falsiroseomonas selenitidurans]